MATSLAAQLSKISAESKNTLNVKAQRSAHSKSLLFEPRVAAGQTFQTIYTVCHEGFQELCHLDGRFAEFGTTLFSHESVDEDRCLMTSSENARLNQVVESFLALVGSRLRLLPAVKALEWLVRRFRIQEYSTESLLTTFLPYHSAPVFLTLMSILPAKLPQQYMFLQPYVRSLTQPPRAALVQATIARPDLLSTISAYTLDACRLRKEYPTLISFWGGVMVQTVNGLLDKLRSGRKSVQADNDQAIVSQVMGTLKDSLLMKDVPGIQIASYMILTVLAAKSSLGDNFFSASMDQVVHGWTSDTVRPGLVCLCILAQQRSAKQLPSKISRSLLKVNNLVHLLQEISQEHRIDKFANGLALSLVERLEKKGDLRCLPLVRDLIGEMLLQNKQLKVILKALLVAAYRINDEADPKGLVRKELGSALVSLARLKDEVGDAVRAVIDETDLNIEQLELRLDALIRPRLAIEGPMEDTSMASNGEVSRGKEVFDDALERLLAQHSSKSSCLISEAGELFDDLCSLFLLAAAGQEDLEKVNNSPVLGRSKATTTVFFFSFYIRVWSGPHPSLARAMAIELVKDRLKDADVLGVDFQAILPYAVAALSDVSKRVRRAAADLLTVMDASCGKTQAARRTRWAQSDLYSNNNVIWMDYDEVQLLLRRIIIPALEECVFDEHQIYGVLKSALDNSRGTEEDDMDKGKHLSRAVKTSILKFFASHVIGTPVLLVKIRLLRALNQVSKVGSTTRTDLLLPVLQWWAGTVTPDEARSLVAREKLDEEVVDRACVDVVVASDGKGLMYLMQLINTAAIAERPSLLSVVFSRLSNLWTSLKKDVQFSTAQKLLELCDFGSSSLPKEVTVEAAVVLQQADLSSDVLVAFLESAHEGNTRAIEASTSKRRQKNHRKDQDDSVDVIQRSPAISTALDKTTFVLELVQEAKPAIELLESLFAILADLQQLRIMVGSELGYMQNLALSSLLAIMPLRKADGSLASGTSVSHGDILATCIQSSNTPTVINTALLLVARLARTAPDVVLHSVMPILTFMGGSVLRQADDYSAHVVNQTIKEVIPPLIDTFKKKRRNLMASTADLLSSFVVAYEHIPPHRKHDTFVLLIQNLGPEDFLFAVLAMFVDKYGTTDNGFAFLMDLLCSFPIEVQLHAMVKLIDLVSDLFKAKPGLSAILLGKHETEEPDEKLPQKIALRELALIPHLLSNVRLRKEIALLGGREDDMQAAKIRHIFADLLEGTLTLADVVRTDKALHTRCGDALSSMLNLLSTAEFINSVETLLDRPSITLRQKVLRALEARVERESVANLEARAALLAFLPQLTAVIRESEDINYKQTAVMCVDRIAEKYGKKDLDAVAAAAATIAGDFCLGQSFQRLRIMALLCLASLVDVLQDSIVPILPSAMPRALSYLRESVEGATQDAELHNAAYAFLTALAQHLPFMVSGDYLDQILECSSISAVKAVEQETRSQRLQCLQFLAKLADAKSLFSALLKNWDKALGAGPLAIAENIQLLALALNKHSRSALAKNVAVVSAILLKALDLRRQIRFQEKTREYPSEIADNFQGSIDEVALKLIYKLNDATFRPVFAQLMEWSATGPSQQDKTGRVLRQQSLFAFLAAFFSSLKSIVTSYATYVVDVAAAILRETDLRDVDDRELWRRVLRTLARCFEHDQDGFWQAPAHFQAVAPLLIDQFEAALTTASDEAGGQQAAARDVAGELVPAVVELAAAADSKEHHKELNGALLKLLRSRDAAVRLAVVRCQQSLTQRLGEEWLHALPEMLPFISELQDDDDEAVERENRRWIVGIEGILGESLDSMLQ